MRSRLAPYGWDATIRKAEEIAWEIKKYMDPTLRSIFYRHSTERWLVHSESAYKQLSKHLARARRAGKFPWDLLVDRSRYEIEGEDELNVFSIKECVEIVTENSLDLLDHLLSIPKWYKQPYHVEVWVEKDAVAGFFRFANREWGLTVFPTRGYSSDGAFYKKVKNFVRLATEGKDIVVLAFTDWDPSGAAPYGGIFAKYEEFFTSVFPLPVKFKRIALTPQQIQKFNLPSVPPDSESYKRILRDPRYKEWVEYCHEMGVPPEPVELDAFVGLYPKDFRNLVEEEIQEWFDFKIFDEVCKLEEERKKEGEKIKEKILEILNEV